MPFTTPCMCVSRVVSINLRAKQNFYQILILSISRPTLLLWVLYGIEKTPKYDQIKLGLWAKSGFSQKDTHTEFSFLFTKVWILKEVTSEKCNSE